MNHMVKAKSDSHRNVMPVVGMALVVAGLIFAFDGRGSVLLPLIVALVGGALLAFLMPDLLLARRWQEPEFEFDQWPLQLGSSPLVTYRLQPRSQVQGGPARVSFTVECIETIEYRQGKNTKTNSTTVYSHEQTTGGATVSSVNGVGGAFEATDRIQIPLDAGAPTMDLAYNDINWRITAQVDGPGYPNRGRRATLVVLPVVDPASVGWLS